MMNLFLSYFRRFLFKIQLTAFHNSLQENEETEGILLHMGCQLAVPGVFFWGGQSG